MREVPQTLLAGDLGVKPATRFPPMLRTSRTISSELFSSPDN
jgi:hypothetical protein